MNLKILTYGNKTFEKLSDKLARFEKVIEICKKFNSFN